MCGCGLPIKLNGMSFDYPVFFQPINDLAIRLNTTQKTNKIHKNNNNIIKRNIK